MNKNKEWTKEEIEQIAVVTHTAIIAQTKGDRARSCLVICDEPRFINNLNKGIYASNSEKKVN